ncbi:MAG: SAM-dependent methyltransferase [Rhizobiales bacterium]|nr:SAM-dependent methyltransferase [Hyphomicrobiales bacterium]MBA70494.1 SAM-dependent methyltransferase [Hyphomicrobiales bacterium]|tara:strand:+ start:2345 stop:3019 length:675 start_codon:yes stop_codon:yes gene_type:complete
MVTPLPASDSTASLMDGIYRYQRHVYDASRRYYLLGRDRMIAELDVPPAGTVLEIACGTARNLVAIAKAYPDARLHGIDISAEMLKSAQATIRRAGHGEHIRLAQADAANLDTEALFGISRFDRIIFSYSLSMIPPWRHALWQAADHLAPGGEIHIVDFSAQSGLPGWFGRALTVWLGKFHVSPRLNLETELALLAAKAGGTSRLTSIYRDYALLGRVRRGPIR